ncbi:MAG: tRNA lysidine(34) synthetase TilS [Actinomycetota bacterium]
MKPDDLAAAAVGSLPDGQLVVALGGGADSAVAAWVSSQRPGTRALFVRHGLEGSDALEAAVRDLAAKLEIPVTYVDAPIEPGSALEERARRERWNAIERSRGPGETIVTGHTLDDQAETVLMNLLRGAGSGGIAGMETGRPGVARPLLRISRTDVREVATELGLPFADDPANESLQHLRNRIRHRLLPQLETEYRPGIRRILARAGALVAADDATIEDLSTDVPILDEPGAVGIPAAVLATVPGPVASRAVRRALRRLLSPYAGTLTDVEAVLAVALGRSESTNVSDGLIARREGPLVVVSRSSVPPPNPVDIAVPSVLAFGDMRVAFETTKKPAVHRRSTLFADPGIFAERIVLRAAVEGDRIDIDGGTKTVRTVLAEHGVPVRRRSAWPVVASDARIVAVAGIRIASWARPATTDTIAITLERNQP